MLLELANACCCFLFRFAFAIMCLIANAFNARSCFRMHVIESPLSYWNNVKEKGHVDIQINQFGLGGEILVSGTLSSYVIGLKGLISSTIWLPIMQSVSL